MPAPNAAGDEIQEGGYSQADGIKVPKIRNDTISRICRFCPISSRGPVRPCVKPQPQSAIRNPQSAIRNPQSAIRNPRGA